MHGSPRPVLDSGLKAHAMDLISHTASIFTPHMWPVTPYPVLSRCLFEVHVLETSNSNTRRSDQIGRAQASRDREFCSRSSQINDLSN